MYCPNCGKQTPTDHRFCRVCGLGLEKIALSLGEQLPARIDETLLARKERLEKIGVAALSVFGLGLLSILGYIIGQKLLTQGSLFGVLAILGLVLMFACGLGSVFLFARAKELGEEATKRQLPGSTEKSSSTRELLAEGSFEPVPTVTERTTELLFAERKRDKE
ncbi:MAG TPA: zinc-ribbon domain-containing protein [Pyrinomonadaceae bacterium]|nr:zinc-ribbon domain-containing protein [Pyrinomonadaceae bacterium]